MSDRIQFDEVSKRYTLGERRNLRETLGGLAKRQGAERMDVWSLRDVSFTVADGEAVGLIGRNGAGKSTALKVLMRITTPTSGESRTRGRVAGLLEVGTGFHPELTGRENIFLNAAVLGMGRADTVRRFDEIVDFAGTERFLDTPVKRYSSGMYLRLAFAVAAHLEPDVLIVDEVLAVGDAEFQRKCLQKMSAAGSEGRTVLFVSHDLAALGKLCARSLWLDGGHVIDEGPTAAVVRKYLTSGFDAVAETATHRNPGEQGIESVRVRAAEHDRPALLREDALLIVVTFAVTVELVGLDVAIFLVNEQGVRVFDETLGDQQTMRFAAGRHEVTLEVPPILEAGDYTVGVWIGTQQEDLQYEPVAGSFTLHGDVAARRDRVVALGLPFTVRTLGT